MLFKLLMAPITLPMAGVKFVFRQVADLADQELNDEGTLRDQLLLLQLQFEEGDVQRAREILDETVDVGQRLVTALFNGERPVPAVGPAKTRRASPSPRRPDHVRP